MSMLPYSIISRLSVLHRARRANSYQGEWERCHRFASAGWRFGAESLGVDLLLGILSYILPCLLWKRQLSHVILPVGKAVVTSRIGCYWVA
ncbi:hypothetical protein BCR39DRAFT_526955 [Naematelia encephala]|uniref:Uncharacterized protein n=1 Tax=Naematelia encephala TaxID=71784 RepID=A0A1Y2B8Y0_9TREE|nr:hypothetical protein BCR39DRAFT_526955 [Naematelia encephala]